jgi:hypothetical protein
LDTLIHIATRVTAAVKAVLMVHGAGLAKAAAMSDGNVKIATEQGKSMTNWRVCNG